MTTKTTSEIRVNVYHDADNHWYYAIWVDGEYDSNGQIDDAESYTEAEAWALAQWPAAEVQEVEAAE